MKYKKIGRENPAAHLNVNLPSVRPTTLWASTKCIDQEIVVERTQRTAIDFASGAALRRTTIDTSLCRISRWNQNIIHDKNKVRSLLPEQASSTALRPHLVA